MKKEMESRILQEIKEKLDIVEFIGGYVELKRVGSYYRGLCPFHQERNPSFFVSPERQMFKCFGCGAAGDVITFYMRIENLEFKEAVERLAEKLGLELDISQKETDFQEIKKILEINRIALNYYKKTLKDVKEALDYLKKRGLKDETIEYFDLGYANEGNFLRDFLLSLGYDIEEIQKAGLLNEKREDKFQSRIIFPLIDIDKKIVGFTGRSFPEKERAPKYLNSPETILFKKSRFIYGLVYSKDYILKEKEAVIVEGQFDFILSFQNNLKNCIAVSGSSLTKEQLQILKKYTNRLVLGFDNDDAGFKASLRAGLLALESKFEIYKLIFDPYKDLAEFFENQNTIENLKKVPFIDYLFDYIENKFDLNDLDNKRKALNLILPFLKYLDVVASSFYINKLSLLLKIKEDFIINELNKVQIEVQEEPETQVSYFTNRLFDLIEKFVALSKLLNKEEEKEILLREMDYEFREYFEEIEFNEEKQDILRLRMLYEELNTSDLEKEFKFIQKEILKEYYKNKINYYKELINNINPEDLENLLKQVKFYTEKLKILEKNA
ncbi:MAG: DNA primase [Candidatus Aenigmatarchaeota archaeon]